MDTRHSEVDEFLACHRIAVVGVSRDRRHFSRAVVAELRRRGYDVVPVNPRGGDSAEAAWARRVQDIAPPPEAVLLLTPPAVSEQVVRDCVEAGVRRMWMHRGIGPGAASRAAVGLCSDQGIAVVTDACIFMHLPHAGFVHRAHRWGREAMRRTPRSSAVTPS